MKKIEMRAVIAPSLLPAIPIPSSIAVLGRHVACLNACSPDYTVIVHTGKYAKWNKVTYNRRTNTTIPPWYVEVSPPDSALERRRIHRRSFYN